MTEEFPSMSKKLNKKYIIRCLTITKLKEELRLQNFGFQFVRRDRRLSIDVKEEKLGSGPTCGFSSQIWNGLYGFEN